MRKKKTRKGPLPGTVYKDVKRTELGNKIAALRIEKGLSQDDLAEKAGLTKRTISFYEREATNIPAVKLQQIANALHVTVDYFLNDKKTITETKSEPTNRAFLKRLEKAKELTPQKQKLIMDMVDNLSK